MDGPVTGLLMLGSGLLLDGPVIGLRLTYKYILVRYS